MYNAFVINLDHRTDRWAKMQSDWSHIFNLHRVPGVKSNKKYLGCGQAHINAIRCAFEMERDKPFYIVLEDDVKPLETKEYYTLFLETLYQLYDSGIDCVSLNSTFDRDVSEDSFHAHPEMDLLYLNPDSNLMSGASFMIYSRTILERMEEYQDHLKKSYFIIPNDRLYSTRQFGFYQFNPLKCFIPLKQICDLSDLANASDNFGGGAFKNYTKNIKRLVQNSMSKPKLLNNTSRQSSASKLSIRVRSSLLLQIVVCCLILFYFLSFKKNSVVSINI